MRFILSLFMGLFLFSTGAIADSSGKDLSNCLQTMQRQYREIEKNGVKQHANNGIAYIAPTNLLVNGNGEVAMMNADGTMRVSMDKGSYVVNGQHSCVHDDKGDAKGVIQMAYDFMSKYDSKYWEQAKAVCNKAGVVTLAAGTPIMGFSSGNISGGPTSGGHIGGGPTPGGSIGGGTKSGGSIGGGSTDGGSFGGGDTKSK